MAMLIEVVFLRQDSWCDDVNTVKCVVYSTAV